MRCVLFVEVAFQEAFKSFAVTIQQVKIVNLKKEGNAYVLELYLDLVVLLI